MATKTARYITLLGVAGLLILAHYGQALAQNKERLVLCVDPLNMPYSEMGVDPPGFDIEIGKRIGKIVGRKVGIYWADTGTMGGLSRALRRSITKGQCNAFMGVPHDEGMIEELAEKGLVLTKPYMVASQVLIVREDSPKVTNIADLADLLTGVHARTWGHGIMVKKRLKHLFFKRPEEVLSALENGKVDVVIMFGPKVGWIIQEQFKGRLEVSKEFQAGAENRWEIGIAVRKEDQELIADLNRALVQLWQEDQINPIMAKYGMHSLKPEGL